MEHSAFFQEVWRDTTQAIPRGVSLGVSIEEVKQKEGPDFYENDDIPYYLSYYFPLKPDAETLYNVIYHFDSEKKVTAIKISLEYDTSMFGNVDEKEFVAMQQEILQFLESTFGKPEVEERKSKRAGHERFSTWTDHSRAIQIMAVQYPDARKEVKHSLRLDFEQLTDE